MDDVTELLANGKYNLNVRFFPWIQRRLPNAELTATRLTVYEIDDLDFVLCGINEVVRVFQLPARLADDRSELMSARLVVN